MHADVGCLERLAAPLSEFLLRILALAGCRRQRHLDFQTACCPAAARSGCARRPDRRASSATPSPLRPASWSVVPPARGLLDLVEQARPADHVDAGLQIGLAATLARAGKIIHSAPMITNRIRVTRPVKWVGMSKRPVRTSELRECCDRSYLLSISWLRPHTLDGSHCARTSSSCWWFRPL